MKQYTHEDVGRAEDIVGPSNRSFGYTFAAIALVLAVFPLLKGYPLRVWALAASGTFFVAAMLAPRTLTYPNLFWLRLGGAMNKIVSPIAMGVLFYVVLTPIGLLMRALGQDPLRLRLDKHIQSYWIRRTPPGPPPKSLSHPY